MRSAISRNNYITFEMDTCTRLVPVIKVISEFTTACYNGDIEMVSFWGGNEEVYTEVIPQLYCNDELSFIKVCQNGHLKVAMWLYSAYPFINLRENFNDIFNIACNIGHLRMVKWIASIDPEFIENKTNLIVPFWKSCSHGKLNIAKWIYANSDETVYSLVDDSSFYDYKYNMFLDICDTRHVSVVRWLLTINPDIDDKDYILSLFNQACRAGELNTAKCILNKYPNINISDEDEISFRIACSWGQTNVAKWLLKIKPDINIKASSNHAFNQACRYGYLDTAKWLFKINPKKIMDEEDRELYYELFTSVCKRGHLDVAKWLYELQIFYNDINLCEIVNFKKSNITVVKWIFETMPNVFYFGNRCDVVSAFKNSCLTGDIELVMMIYEPLSDYISERPLITSCAFAWACCSGNLELVNTLLQKFNNIEISIYDELAFISACANGQLMIAKRLLEIKPDIKISIRDDKAFKKACVNGHLDVCQWLVNMFPEKYSIGEELFIENDLELGYADDDDGFVEGIYRNTQGDIVTEYTYEYIISKTIHITKTIQEEEITREIENCTICLDTKSNVYTDCRHFYCQPCISKWLKTHDDCPYCRINLNEENMYNIQLK